MPDKIDISPAVAFSEASAEATFWRKQSLINAIMRNKAEEQVEELKKEIEQLTKQLETQKGSKNANK